MTWGSTAVRLQTLDSRILFCNISVKALIPDLTLKTLLEVLTWSINALASGLHPKADHTGKEFTKDYHKQRWLKAGKPLAGNKVGAWSEQRGDWSYLRLAYGFKRWWRTTGTGICHLCEATT
jgi:hypothetical protein